MSGPAETEKTVKTDIPTNDDFLRAVFGADSADNLPLLVSFQGNPNKVSSKAWYGRPWLDDNDSTLDLPSDANNYFSLATFSPDESGQYRRRKSNFHALYAVMLDDIGTKVAIERLTLAPTWLLETSAGNHQAGYILNEPLMDGPAADHLMNAIVTAGLCDPGANGPRARLARLPVASNGKHSPLFQCRLVDWSPQLRYSVNDLVNGLQLESINTGRPKKRSTSPAEDRPDDGDPILIPCPEDNTVLSAMRGRGLYKVPLGSGKHDITCPWVQEHTGGVDGGTAYFEPDDNWPIGGFKCLHGHCALRNIRDLLTFLNVDVRAARMKPIIRITPGELVRVVDAAERELARSRQHYQRGGSIVTVTTDPGTHETRVQDASQPALVRALAGVASWERFDRRSEDWVRSDPPSHYAGILFDSTRYPHLPVLDGLAHQPYLRPDGSLVTVAGYDTTTFMFGVFNAREFDVPEKPTRRQAEEALIVLQELLVEFAFTDRSDLAAALAAMLTAAIRPSLNQAPMIHVRAHMSGSGKTYLCELITAFATPQRGTPTTFPGEDEECRKLLLAELLRAPAVIEFDNLTGDLLAHKSLCSVLTSEYLRGRILGASKTTAVRTRALFLSSGNNVGPIQDMTRRCITIHLDPSCEIPAARTFQRPNLVKDVLRERGRFVSAALTIVRAWLVAGKPKIPCKPLASYGEWSDLCRQPLIWLGCADPATSVFETITEDPDRETLDRLLTAWQSAFGGAPAMVRDALKKAYTPHDEYMDLREILHDIAEERGTVNRRRLGRWIKRHDGRIVNGRRFVRATGNRPAEAWRVESVSSVSSVTESLTEKTVSDTIRPPF